MIPTIHGNGIHDDSDGFLAALAGQPFHAVDECVKVAKGFGLKPIVQLERGRFYLRRVKLADYVYRDNILIGPKASVSTFPYG